MTPSILPVVTAIQAQWAKDLREGAKMPRGKAIRLTVTKRAADWHVCLRGNPKVWACGKTQCEAVGDWFLTHGNARLVPQP